MYTALYRKWRPRSFDDVISQPYITTALKNQIKNLRTAHSYLFTGSRGTGKTTCARIFAKAVNCLHPVDGNPCLECEICRNADISALTDIVEIDAASNNGVGDVRDLRDGIIYTPEICKFRIYIIDEVHMLSQSAFNALLKTMEEPPPFVKFILATTEIHKVPATILSRCQRFDFSRIKTEDISKRIRFIASEENINIQQEAADLIASAADGGMRDAISLLDQCSALADCITPEIVETVSGISSEKSVLGIINAAVNRDAPSALRIIDSLYSKSKDMQKLCDEITIQFRNIMMIKAGMPSAESGSLKDLASRTDMNTVLHCLSALQDCLSRMSRCINKRTEIEMCIIKLCTSPATSYNQQLQPTTTPPTTPIQPPVIKPKKLNPENFSPVRMWSDMTDELYKTNPAIVGALSQSSALVNDKDNQFLIIADNPFFLTLFKNNETNRISLENIIRKFFGKNLQIIVNCKKKPVEEQKNALKLIDKASAAGIPVETEI